MATLNSSRSYDVVTNSSKETIFIQTSETSIPAINYGGYSQYKSMDTEGGLTGIAIELETNYSNNLGNGLISEIYLYGNKTAISLPAEIGSSVSGSLNLIDTETATFITIN